MALSLKHAFTSPKSDGTDATLVQPSNWNAEHYLTLGTAKLVGRTTSGTGAAEEISVGAGLTLSAGSLTGNVVTVAGRTGAITLAVADVTGAAPLASPTFTGTLAAAAGTFSGTLGVSGTLTGVAGTFSGALSGSTVADAAGTIRPIILGTVQATTSGTSKDFTGIPSWAKRVTVNVAGVSTNGSAPMLVQLGTSAGVETTGYLGSSGYIQNASQSLTAALSGGVYLVKDHAATNLTHGSMVFTLVDATTNTWAVIGLFGNSSNVVPSLVAGSKALAGTLDRIRLTTTNGTDTFDAGSVNILYE